MRKLLLQMGISLDGYLAQGGMSDWGLPPEDPGLKRWKIESLRGAGVHIMGRVTYAEMAGHWPSSTDDYAAPMNEIPKVVFSKTLTRADWADSQIARGDLAEEIARLKAEPGKDIVAHGGAAFVQALSRLSLIDEYRLVIHPVALGNGLPLFKDLAAPLPLRLVEAMTFATGSALHVYETKRAH
jgi:dihydrofolate reductase